MTNSTYRPGNERLKEAIMVVLSHSDDIGKVGMKKLAKLLYFADFNHYKETFESITREDYERFDHGPMPSSLYEAVEQLKEEGMIRAKKNRLTRDMDKWDFEIAGDFEPQYLPDAHRERIVEIVNRFDRLSANELEDLSHRDTPWQVTDNRAQIDYTLVFYRDEDIEELVE